MSKTSPYCNNITSNSLYKDNINVNEIDTNKKCDYTVYYYYI